MATNGLDAQRPGDGSYVVRAPKPTDAMQGALRSVYDREERLPADLAALMERLDRIS
jgi:hypothetical protein